MGGHEKALRLVDEGLLLSLVRPARFERATFRFVAECSIQLSHGRAVENLFMQKRRRRQAIFQEFLNLVKNWSSIPITN